MLYLEVKLTMQQVRKKYLFTGKQVTLKIPQ